MCGACYHHHEQPVVSHYVAKANSPTGHGYCTNTDCKRSFWNKHTKFGSTHELDWLPPNWEPLSQSPVRLYPLMIKDADEEGADNAANKQQGHPRQPPIGGKPVVLTSAHQCAAGAAAKAKTSLAAGSPTKTKTKVKDGAAAKTTTEPEEEFRWPDPDEFAPESFDYSEWLVDNDTAGAAPKTTAADNEKEAPTDRPKLKAMPKKRGQSRKPPKTKRATEVEEKETVITISEDKEEEPAVKKKRRRGRSVSKAPNR